MTLSPKDVAQYYRARMPKMRQQGSQWRSPCPIHNGTRDSFAVSPFDGTWCCHSECSRGGSVADLEMELSRCDFATAKSAIESIIGRQPANGSARTVIACYEYRDEQANPLFRVVRTLPKGFYQQRWDGSQWVTGLGDVRRVLYRLPELLAKSDKTVFVAEGERDVDTLRQQGFVATSNAGGAGKWRDEYSDALAGRKVIILPDGDEPGKRHAEQVAQSLYGKAALVRVVALPGAKDATEWFEQNHTSDELRALCEAAPDWKPDPKPDPAPKQRVETRVQPPKRKLKPIGGGDCAAIVRKEIKPMEWTVKEILPKGLYMLADREKGGKSYLAMQIALAVAYGRSVFPNSDRFRAGRPGKVHYWDLEMDEATFQERMHFLDASDLLPDRMWRWTDLDRLTATGSLQIADMLDRKPADLIVIDTLMAATRNSGTKYQDVVATQYDEVARLRDLCHERDITGLIVAHTSKAVASNIFDTIAGSRGRAAATDGNLVISRAKGVMTLHGVGRRLGELEIAIKLWRKGVPGWSLLGNAEDVRRSAERDEILRVLTTDGASLPKEIASALRKKGPTVRYHLMQMARDGEVERDSEGRYTAVLTPAEAGTSAE